MTDHFPPLPPLTSGTKVTGLEREILGMKLRLRYEAGMTVQQLADQLRRSYAFVHNVLAEAETPMRGRGSTGR